MATEEVLHSNEGEGTEERNEAPAAELAKMLRVASEWWRQESSFTQLFVLRVALQAEVESMASLLACASCHALHLPFEARPALSYFDMESGGRQP